VTSARMSLISATCPETLPLNSERPGRNVFAQGAKTIALDAGGAYWRDLRRAVGAGDSSLSSSMRLLIRLPYLCRDAATAADIVAMCQCPGPNIARTR
jgi:predicted secreted protein